MPNCIGFSPVSRSNARVLILGTLPGAESLKQQQYYAHRQNKFWKIMGELVGASPDLPYKKRLKQLTKNKIALWDVCETAQRKGSLDADIRCATPNDFDSFFKKHKNIEFICFNGQPAQKLFRRHVKKNTIASRVLPSTSPAHAKMRYEQKLVRWREALRKSILLKSGKTCASKV
jgi:hypoxanthine-DNA glycosylase